MASIAPPATFVHRRSRRAKLAGSLTGDLGIIALKGAGVIAASPATLVTLGDLHSPGVVLAVLGFLAMVALDVRKVPGAIIIGILGVTAVGIALGLNAFGGVMSLPPSIAPVLLKMDVAKALEIGLIAIVLCVFEWIRESRYGAAAGVVAPDPAVVPAE